MIVVYNYVSVNTTLQIVAKQVLGCEKYGQNEW